MAGGERARSRSRGSSTTSGRDAPRRRSAARSHALGVRDAFGVIGSGNFVVTQALHAAGARFHHARHEGGAICMADGYARVSGRVGVCSVHQGPGFTNMLTGLTEAAKSRTPLLVLAGDTPAAAVRSNFRVDQAGVAATLGAVAGAHPLARRARWPTRRGRCGARRSSGGRSCSTCRSTCRRAPPRRTGRRPRAAPPPEPAPPPPAAVERVAELVAARRRPLILAGRGAVLAGARAAAGGARRRDRRRARHLGHGPRAVRRHRRGRSASPAASPRRSRRG